MRYPLVAALLALVAAAPAAAHLSVTPGVLESGEETTLRVELPAFRPRLLPSALEISGEGLQMLSSRPSGQFGGESRWFLRVRVDAVPGPLQLRLLVRYADGHSIEVAQTATVVPSSAGGSSSRLGLWAAGAVVVVLASGGALFGLRRLRRA
jgi:hypothetical protein